MSRGILLVISGFSGAGKGTVMKELLQGKNRREDCCLSISATSRKPRNGEVDGREYYFKTREEFEAMIKADEFLEYAEYVENYYGTPKKYVLEQLEKGINVILEIEVNGAKQIKQKYPEAVLVFITPPDVKELEKRLRGRQTESEEVIADRLRTAQRESEEMKEYDYLIVNDEVDACVERLSRLIDCKKQQMSNQQVMVQKIQKELYQLNAK